MKLDMKFCISHYLVLSFMRSYPSNPSSGSSARCSYFSAEVVRIWHPRPATRYLYLFVLSYQRLANLAKLSLTFIESQLRVQPEKHLNNGKLRWCILQLQNIDYDM